MEGFIELHNSDNARLYNPRIFRGHNNPLELYNGEKFRQRFPFTKELVRDFILVDILADLSLSRRNGGLTLIQQLRCALRIYASGSFHYWRYKTEKPGVVFLRKLAKRVS